MAEQLWIEFMVRGNHEHRTLSLPPHVEIPDISPETPSSYDEKSDFGEILEPDHQAILSLPGQPRLLQLYRVTEVEVPSMRKPEFKAYLTLVAEYDERGKLKPLELRPTPQ